MHVHRRARIPVKVLAGFLAVCLLSLEAGAGGYHRNFAGGEALSPVSSFKPFSKITPKNEISFRDMAALKYVAMRIRSRIENKSLNERIIESLNRELFVEGFALTYPPFEGVLRSSGKRYRKLELRSTSEDRHISLYFFEDPSVLNEAERSELRESVPYIRQFEMEGLRDVWVSEGAEEFSAGILEGTDGNMFKVPRPGSKEEARILRAGLLGIYDENPLMSGDQDADENKISVSGLKKAYTEFGVVAALFSGVSVFSALSTGMSPYTWVSVSILAYSLFHAVAGYVVSRKILSSGREDGIARTVTVDIPGNRPVRVILTAPEFESLPAYVKMFINVHEYVHLAGFGEFMAYRFPLVGLLAGPIAKSVMQRALAGQNSKYFVITERLKKARNIEDIRAAVWEAAEIADRRLVPHVAELLGTPNDDVRKIVLDYLMEFGDRRIFGQLVDKLSATDEYVRRRSLEILEKKKASPKLVRVGLTKAAGSLDSHVRDFALEALAVRGLVCKEKLPLWTKMLRSDDVFLRRGAFNLIDRIVPVTERKKEIREAVVNDPRRDVRIASLLILAEMGETEDLGLLLDVSQSDRDELVREYAGVSVSRIYPGYPEKISRLCYALRSGSYEKRKSALQQIESLRAGRGLIPYWRRALGDTRRDLSIAAALVLSELKDEESFDRILEMTKSSDEDIRYYAGIALKRMDLNRPEMVPIWTAELRSDDTEKREYAMTRLEKLRAGRENIKYWKRSLTDHRKELRIVAALVLAELRAEDAFEDIFKMVAEKDDDIRLYAGKALERMDIERPEMVPFWVQGLREGDREQRGKIMNKLGKFRSGKDRIDYWRKGLDDRREDLVISSLMVLAELRDRASLEKMYLLRSRGSHKISKYADIAIKRIYDDISFGAAAEKAEKIRLKSCGMKPVIPAGSMIVHIVDNSIVVPEQRELLGRLDIETRKDDYREKIVSISPRDDKDFIRLLEKAIKRQRKLYADRKIYFTVACSRKDIAAHLTAKDSDLLHIKALAFEPSSRAVQVEGIILALRAFYADEPLVALRNVYELLTGKKVTEHMAQFGGIKEFVRRTKFTLPPAQTVNIENGVEIDRLIERNIRTSL